MGPAWLARLLSGFWVTFGFGMNGAGAAEPVFLKAGPFGDPFAVQSGQWVTKHRSSGEGLRLQSMPPEQGPSRAQAPIDGVASRSQSEAKPADSEDEEAIQKPGRFSNALPILPNPAPFRQLRTMGPHLLPDLEYAVNERVNFGVLGQVDRLKGIVAPIIARTLPIAPTRATKATTGTRGRDAGFGLSLEMKIGP